MTNQKTQAVAIIGGIGVESRFSEALIETLLNANTHVVAVARNRESKATLVRHFENDNRVEFVWGDLADQTFMTHLVEQIESRGRIIQAYIHNPARLILKPYLECTLQDFEACWEVAVKTAVVATQAILPAMLGRNSGSIIFSGATASMQGNAKSSPFASSKFAVRAISQSLAREFGPQGIHVAHVVIDGVIQGARAQEQFGLAKEACIEPDALARLYHSLIEQETSCWTQEIDVRPAVGKF